MPLDRRSLKYVACFGLLVVVLVTPALVAAECLKDRYGEVFCGAGKCMIDTEGTVWCSRYHDGDVDRTLDGYVLCGKGDCEKRSDGLVFCSTEIGGAVLLDSSGNVRCYGQCEPATAEMCENTIAGSSKN